MQTSINIDSFQDQFVSGLLYSLVEGLTFGESIRIESKSNFQKLLNEICSSSNEEINCTNWSQSETVCTAILMKIPPKKTDSCCGFCG